MNLAWRFGSLLLLFASLFSCTTFENHTTARSNKEQSLLAIAVDRVSQQIPTEFFNGRSVQIVSHALAPDVESFVTAALHRRLTERGVLVQDISRGQSSDTVLHLLINSASGESSTWKLHLLIPITFISTVSVFEKNLEEGDIEIEGYLTEAGSGRFIASLPRLDANVFIRRAYFLTLLGPFRNTNLTEDEKKRIKDY